MLTQHRYLTTHDNRGNDTRAGHLITFPQRKCGLVSGTREEAMPTAMQTEQGRHAAATEPAQCWQWKQNSTNRKNRKTAPLRWISVESFTVLRVTCAARWPVINRLKSPRGPASQGLLLPTRTGQAGASWEPESCHSWGAGKKTGGVRQPQTGWDKQAT